MFTLILKMLATHYSEDDIKSVSIVEGGCANLNVLVHLYNSNTPVILRIYLRDQESIYREQKLSKLLYGKLPVPDFYYINENFGYTFAITEYLPGQTLFDFLLRDKPKDINKIMLKVGKALGNISNITFPRSGFFNNNLEISESITRQGFVKFCLESLEDTKVKALITVEQRKKIETIIKIYKNLLPNESENKLVHADFDPANILVKEDNGEIEIFGILDWEFSCKASA